MREDYLILRGCDCGGTAKVFFFLFFLDLPITTLKIPDISRVFLFRIFLNMEFQDMDLGTGKESDREEAVAGALADESFVSAELVFA